MHTRQTTLLLVSSILQFLFLPNFISAQLSCQSPTSLPANTLQPGTPLTLKFTNKPSSLGSALLSDVSANLICSSTGDSVLTLATKLSSGKTTSVTLSLAQVSSALKACPANSFNVQYEEDTFLSKNTESCQGSFSIEPPATTKQPQLDAGKNLAIVHPSLSISLPIPDVPATTTPSTTGSPSTTPTVVEPQPKTTTTVPPIVPATTTATVITTTGVPPVVVPPNPSSTTTPALGTTTVPHKKPHPPAPTTTTRPPKSGGGKGDGGNDNNNSPSTSPPTPSPSNDLASSDMQQSSGTGPSAVTIAGISIGILAGVFVILGAILVWRKRAQRRADFDLFYGDTLAAASGFQPSGSSSSPSSSAAVEQPIYGRSAPEEEKYEMNGDVGGAALSRKISSNVPRHSRSHTSNHTNNSPHMQSSAPPPQPPPLMPMHPLPTATGAGQDASYYHQQQQQDAYYANQQYHQQQDYYASQHQNQHQHHNQQQQQPPKRKPSYRLPRHHPAFDYEQSFGQR